MEIKIESGTYKSKGSDLNDEKKIAFAIVILFFSLFLNSMFNSIPVIESSIFVFIPKLIFIISFFRAIPSCFRNLSIKNILIIIVLFFFFLSNFYFGDNLQYFSVTFKNFLNISFPAFILGLVIRDLEILYDYFLKFSKISSLILFFFYVSGLLNMNDKLYLMGLGYSLLIFVMFLLNDVISQKNIWSAISAIFMILFLFGYASRGILICIFAFFFFFMYKNIIFNKNRKESIFMIMLLFIIYLVRENIINGIFNLFERLNIYSRTLYSLKNGTISQTSGRDIIYSKLWEDFSRKPFKIRGINADYNLVGIYSHNIFLELLYEFGIIFGFIIIIIIIYSIFKSLHMDFGYNKNIILLSLLSVWLPYLLISSSLWVTPHFWLFIGLIINSKEKGAFVSRL